MGSYPVTCTVARTGWPAMGGEQGLPGALFIGAAPAAGLVPPTVSELVSQENRPISLQILCARLPSCGAGKGEEKNLLTLEQLGPGDCYLKSAYLPTGSKYPVRL